MLGSGSEVGSSWDNPVSVCCQVIVSECSCVRRLFVVVSDIMHSLLLAKCQVAAAFCSFDLISPVCCSFVFISVFIRQKASNTILVSLGRGVIGLCLVNLIRSSTQPLVCCCQMGWLADLSGYWLGRLLGHNQHGSFVKRYRRNCNRSELKAFHVGTLWCQSGAPVYGWCRYGVVTSVFDLRLLLS